VWAVEPSQAAFPAQGDGLVGRPQRWAGGSYGGRRLATVEQ
jgi:hypothetical protein